MSCVTRLRSVLTPKTALLWHRFRDHKQRVWEVHLCDPLDTPELGDDYEGRLIFDAQLILMSVIPSREKQDLNWYHEYSGHLAYDADGGLTEPQEESAMLAMEKSGLYLAKRLGYRVPPRPHGADALERRARARWAAHHRYIGQEAAE